MYKIPTDFEFDSITGKTIDQIAFGSNVIVLYFNGGYVQTSGSFELTIAEKTTEFEEIFPLTNDLGLLRLLDNEISEVLYASDNFILKFCNGSKLVLKGMEAYETYSICIGERTVVV